jgi:hypothetical protein
MSKIYLLVYGNSSGTREQVKSYLESIGDITHWRYDLPNVFYVVSTLTAQELSERLHAIMPNKQGEFLFTELESNYQGWLAEETWYLINNKEFMPNEKLKT